MLNSLSDSQLENIKDDPVRPHIDPQWRVSDGREVYSLTEDQYAEFDEVLHEGPTAIICVSYCNEIPTSEEDLITYNDPDGNIAVFYTVWSYDPGAGREIVRTVAEHIKQHHKSVIRYVTLSPLTVMAERFHTRNGAKLIFKHDTCQNFEYTI